MLKSINHFFLLFCTVLIVTGCTNTPPKETNNFIWDNSVTNPNNMSLVKPNLTGLWILNKELSENPQQAFKENMRKSSDSGGNKSKNGRGGGGGGGEHSGSGKGKGGKQGKGYARNKNNTHGYNALPQELHALLNAPETLELEHEEPLLSILTENGQEKVYTDFRSSSVSSSNHANQKAIVAGWENNTLVVEHTLSSGRVIQQFNLDSASGKLWIDTLISTTYLPKPVEFSSVYERVKQER